MKRIAPFLLLALIFVLSSRAWAQFRDDFDDSSIRLDQSAKKGWTFFTGDGSAGMDFRQGEGFASVLVDATQDRRNIWWALIKRDVSSALDLRGCPGPLSSAHSGSWDICPQNSGRPGQHHRHPVSGDEFQ
jgi:hypothetical protein